MKQTRLPFSAVLLAVAAPAGVVAGEAGLPDLAAHRWKDRVLVIDTPTVATTEAYRTQAAMLLPVWEGLRERDLFIVTREGAAVFRVRLVGKDGGVKLDAREPVRAAELFALIDAMPMRRDEMRRATRE